MIAKVVLLCAAVAAIDASHHVGLINTGSSISSRQQDDFGNYAFNYGIADGLGATNSRAEVGDAHGNKKGSYSLTDIDGRARRVDYVADGLGFRAAVKTNEPGTALSAPAAAVVASPYAGPLAPVAVGHSVAAVAPALVSHSVAPVAHVAAVSPTFVGHSVAAPVYAAAPALVASKGVPATNFGIAGPLGYAAAPIGIAGPIGYAASPVGISGHGYSGLHGISGLGYAGLHGVVAPRGYAGLHGVAAPLGHAGLHGVAAPLGYAGLHGVAAPLGYAGHLGYGAGLAKAIY